MAMSQSTTLVTGWYCDIDADQLVQLELALTDRPLYMTQLPTSGPCCVKDTLDNLNCVKRRTVNYDTSSGQWACAPDLMHFVTFHVPMARFQFLNKAGSGFARALAPSLIRICGMWGPCLKLSR